MPNLCNRTYKTYTQAVNSEFQVHTIWKADLIWQMQNTRHLKTVNKDTMALELLFNELSNQSISMTIFDN